MARARLAYVSIGQRSLTAPRHAAEKEHDEPPESVTAEPAARARTVTPIQLAALGVILLVALTALTFSYWKTRPEAVPLTVESSHPTTAVSPSPEPSKSDETPQQVRVHVIGGVNKPGVVRVDADAIVADAIEAAGGIAKGAKPGNLNLAAPVAAGMQIRVGVDGTESHIEGSAPGTAPGQANGKVSLNQATQSQLEELPGVGPVTAAAIISWREEHGPFKSTAELQEISGIGPKTYAKLEPLVTT